MKLLLAIMAGLILTVGVGSNELSAQWSGDPAVRANSDDDADDYDDEYEDGDDIEDEHETSPRPRKCHTHVKHVIRKRKVWVPASTRIERRLVQERGYYKMVRERRYDHCGNAYYVRVKKYIPGCKVWKNVRVKVPGHYVIKKVRVAITVKCSKNHSKKRKCATKVPTRKARADRSSRADRPFRSGSRTRSRSR